MSFRITDRDNGFEAFFEGLSALRSDRVKVGIQGREASQIRPGGISMVGLGVIHEFGAPNANIPQRSFIRSTADVNNRKYQNMMIRSVTKLTRRPDSFNAQAELLKLGETVRGDIVKRIKSAQIKQDLAESTKTAKARKAGGTVEPALIDTGLLVQSISVVIT